MDVEYEGTGDNASCSICGRTKVAAEQTNRSRIKQRRDAKLKWVWITLGAIGVIALIGFFIANGASERMLGTLIATTVQAVGLVSIIWIVLKIKKFLSHKSNKDS